MKGRYSLFFCLGFLLCGGIWLTSCSTIKETVKSYPSDNIVEELCEEIIEYKTGKDIDLSFWDNEEFK